MRILWASNAPIAKSGYGIQTALFAPRLQQVGHQVAIFAFAGHGVGSQMGENGIPIFPRLYDEWGNDVVIAHAHHFEADIILGLFDPWAAENYGNFDNWAHWTPVDSAPLLPGNAKALQKARWVVAMSRFGQEQLRKAGFNTLYIPHGVDTAVYKPIDRSQAKKRLGEHLKVDLSDKWLIAMNAANRGRPSRKGFYQAFQAFKTFSVNHREAVLYLHTDEKGLRGEELVLMIDQLGIPKEKVLFPNYYHYMMGMLSAAYLNDVYNSAEVLLHPSHGEGFGIPLIEAQAAGCPVITTDFSAMSELAGNGWKVGGRLYNYLEGTEWMMPNVQELGASLEQAWRFAKDRRDGAREFALQYDVEHVLKTWMLPALDLMERDLQEQDRRELPRRIHQKKTQPDVSLVMPLYNVERYGAENVLERIQRSVQQGGLKVEVCICNDGSTDDTAQILAGWAVKYPFIKITQNAQNMGSSEACNTGASIATGRYIGLLSARGWYEPCALLNLVGLLDSHPSKGFVYGDTQYHGVSDFLNMPPREYDKTHFLQGFPSLHGYLYKRKFWDKGCRYTPYLHKPEGVICVGDRDFMMQMIVRHGAEGIVMPQLAYHYWWDGAGQMSNLVQQYNDEMVAIFNQRWGTAVTCV